MTLNYEESKNKFPNHVFINGTTIIKRCEDFINWIGKLEDEKYLKVILIFEIDKLPSKVIFFLKNMHKFRPVECLIFYRGKSWESTKVDLNDNITFNVKIIDNTKGDNCPVCLEEFKEKTALNLVICSRCEKIWCRKCHDKLIHSIVGENYKCPLCRYGDD
jgi:hypothetical protein